MDDYITDLDNFDRTTFSLVIAEFRQKFTEKNQDDSFDEDCGSTNSSYGPMFTETDQSWSCSTYRIQEDITDLTSAFSLVIEELQQKFTEKNHGAESEDDCSSTSSGFGSLVTDSDGEQPPKITEAPLEQEKLKPIPGSLRTTPAPRPENLYGWQNGCYSNGGMTRHTNCIDLDTDMTDRFIIQLKPRKQKRGLLSRLRFWKKKSSKDVCSDEIKNIDKNNSRVWGLFCCFSQAE